MLSSLTKKYHDKSTYDFFQFEFYCDRCGSSWVSDKYFFSLANDKPRSLGEKNARDILWKAEHDNAYERANTEAILKFNKCTKCNRRVCDKCFSELGDTCLDCENKSKEG